MIGQTISHYRITDKLGEGGMGVVYKAEDTKLERTVALKFLAAHLVSDEDIRKRFEREAKAAASLNHPNICDVYEIDEAEGKTFAMVFLEGQGLDEKIAAGPLKLDEALDIAYQIAQGLLQRVNPAPVFAFGFVGPCTPSAAFTRLRFFLLGRPFYGRLRNKSQISPSPLERAFHAG